jgi:signal transduction protein with GAF and PtsI domain
LQLVEGTVLMPVQGSHTTSQTVENWLADDPLVREAIASQTIQGAVNIANDTALANVPHYQKSGIQAHLSVPVIHKGRSIALISIQWKQPCSLRPDELTTVHLAAQEVALVLTSFQGN